MSHLARLDGLIKRIDVAVTLPPADGSGTASELADETGAHTYDLAVMGMTAAIDHLHAWRFLLAAGVTPTYADMSLSRTRRRIGPARPLAGRAGDRLCHPAGPARRRPGR